MPPIDSPPDAQQRRDAADVRHSVIVQAPAGSGKTTLLVVRLLNLLAIVERPEEILAITFTRKAAAEMRVRVITALSENDERAQTIRRRGATLGWGIDSLTARLRIQTIDAFCATLTRSLPIASRLGDALAVTTDTRPLYADAVRRTFERVDADTPLSAELVRLLALFDNDYARMHDALVAMLGRRDQWFELVAHVLRGAVRRRVAAVAGTGAVGAEIDAAIERLQHGAFDDIESGLDRTITDDLVRIAAERAARLNFDWRWSGTPDSLDGWAFIADLVSTRDGKARSRFGEAQGFASGTDSAREKAELKSLAAELDRRGLMEQLASIR
ncbi:MAG TPA: UvrD-helicase domain-containing protein, partial [Pseudomonadales bacterium]|nr:UvrD-helicase domain-containing protein [Pseudomonadales bacterium]